MAAHFAPRRGGDECVDNSSHLPLRRFYIGCDLCTNWYHGECVGITEKEAKKMDDYICVECKRGQEASTEELYCICQTPYDESQ